MMFATNAGGPFERIEVEAGLELVGCGYVDRNREVVDLPSIEQEKRMTMSLV